MDWVISDTHFYHTNIIKYCDRPFANAEEMDSIMMFNWNKAVEPEDTVYHLGDFAYGKGSKERIRWYLNQLNGTKILIRGNHDRETVSWYRSRGFYNVIGGEYWEYEKGVLLSHRPYPTKYPMINIYGHVHNLMGITGTNYRCVCVEQINYTPIDLQQLIKDIKRG